MNRFGRIAQERWKALAPTAYAQIVDPSSHFSSLGESAEKAWIDLADEMTGPDVEGETYFEKVGRINAARSRAQEMIEADWLTPPADQIEPDPQDDGDQVDQESARRMALWLAEDPERWQLTGALSLQQALELEHGITLQTLGWTAAELDEMAREAAL